MSETKKVDYLGIFLLLVQHTIYLLVILYLVYQLGDAKQSCDQYYTEKVEAYIRDNSACLYGNERYNTSKFILEGFNLSIVSPEARAAGPE